MKHLLSKRPGDCRATGAEYAIRVVLMEAVPPVRAQNRDGSVMRVACPVHLQGTRMVRRRRCEVVPMARLMPVTADRVASARKKRPAI